jgi:hypothetical protein
VVNRGTVSDLASAMPSLRNFSQASGKKPLLCHKTLLVGDKKLLFCAKDCFFGTKNCWFETTLYSCKTKHCSADASQQCVA